MENFAKWCLCTKDYTYDSNLNIWFNSKTLTQLSWEEIIAIYEDKEPDITQLEYKFYDSIKLPMYYHDDMSGGSWLTDFKDEGEARMFIYVNATWLFYDEGETTEGIEVIYKDGNDEFNDALPKREFFKFTEPTNLIELANYKQFYLGLLESLTKKYLVKSK